MRQITYGWSSVDELHLKVKDSGSGRILDKVRVGINDTKRLAEALYKILEKYGVDLEDLYYEMKELKQNSIFYFKPEKKSPFSF